MGGGLLACLGLAGCFLSHLLRLALAFLSLCLGTLCGYALGLFALSFGTGCGALCLGVTSCGGGQNFAENLTQKVDI